MIKETITYKDYDGNTRKETHYFNLTEFEATELALELPDDVFDDIGNDPSDNGETEVATHLVEKLGAKGIKDFVKSIVEKSYGVKGSDGKRFIKSAELFTEFSQTPAYSNFMMKLLRDDTAASKFINGVIPPELAAKMTANKMGSVANKPELVTTDVATVSNK